MKAKTKPWGYEYLFYENRDIAIWHLVINAGHRTSLHCHPNKKTGLLILNGIAEISFLSGDQILKPLDKIMIRQGVFHRTKNIDNKPLHLLEIETPVKKTDIVRLEDDYNRTEWTDELEIDVPILYDDKIKYGDLDNSLHDITHIIFTEGGIYKENITIASPGDILSFESFNKLTQKFHLCNARGFYV